MYSDLGDVRVSQQSGTAYDGEVGSPSMLNLDYYRDIATRFQVTLNQLDQGLRAAYIAEAANVSPAINSQMRAYINQIEAKRAQLKTTAAAINAGAAVINAAGGRFPVLSVPAGLSAVPLVLPAATVAALAAAVALITWGAQIVSGINERLLYAKKIEGLNPEQRADIAQASEQAARADSYLGAFRPFAGFGEVIKWGGIALAAFMLWRAFAPYRGR